MLAFLGGFFLPASYGNFLQASSLQDQETPYDSMVLDEAILSYHTGVNATVNEYLEHLLDANAAEYGYVNYPPEDDLCTPNNFSTYCLAVRLNQELLGFEIYLEKNKDKVNDLLEDERKEEGVVSLEDALEAATAQRTAINDQILLARDALDLSLAVYDQVQIVYPVHVQMNALIRNMEEYRDQLAAVRRVVELYPSKFNGASTIQCQ